MSNFHKTGVYKSISLFLFLCAMVEHAFGASPAPIYAQSGIVVSASHIASDVGAGILRDGGNAFDAAAAVGFALAVTYPQAGNIGGGGFAVAVTGVGESIALDFRETAPAKAHRDMYLDAQGNVIEGLSLRSPLASGVPGSVHGLLKLWRDHGSGNISRRRLLAPAIKLARGGFPISRQLAQSLNAGRSRFEKDPGASSIFFRPETSPWRMGDKLTQKDLAASLKLIAKRGPAGFYRGKTAELLAQQHSRSGGLITQDDLANYTSVYRIPIVGTFHEYEIVSMPPPSSGGILLVQMLNMLESFDLEEMGWHSADSIHLLTEVQRRAYADRAEHLGDPDFWQVPSIELTTKAYAQKRASDINMTMATPSANVYAGKPSSQESSETTHYSVADGFGNAVAVTVTLNTSFGSGIVVEGAGFLMNNEMDDFSAKPGVPNTYGLVGNEANAIAPGKRMLSSMTPTVVLKDGRPYLVLGTPGGSTIITTVLQNFLNVVVHDMNIQEAVSAPRHHSQWLPNRIVHESRSISEDTLNILRGRGHETFQTRILGQANAIMITPDGFWGAPDVRSDNAASGY